jgi:ribosomal protein L10
MKYFLNLFHAFEAIPTFIRTWLTNLKGASKKVFIGFLMVLCFILLSISLSLTQKTNLHLIHLSSMQSQQSQTLLTQLKMIQNEMDVLQNNMGNTTALKNGLTDIDQQLVAMQQTIVTMKTDMTAALKEFHTVSNNTTANEAVQLDVKALPFIVQTLDVIAETPLVTVVLDHRQLPLTIGDSLAGWQLVKANYSQSIAIFQNDEHQLVTVNIAGGAP